MPKSFRRLRKQSVAGRAVQYAFRDRRIDKGRTNGVANEIRMKLYGAGQIFQRIVAAFVKELDPSMSAHDSIQQLRVRRLLGCDGVDLRCRGRRFRLPRNIDLMAWP